MKIISPAILLTAIVASISCGGCSKKPLNKQNNAIETTVSNQKISTKNCNKYAFLQKYGCSLALIQDSAINGDPDAQYALGYMYYNGIGTTQDKANARLWIHRAAKANQQLALKAETILAKKDSATASKTKTRKAKTYKVQLAQAKTTKIAKTQLSTVKRSKPTTATTKLKKQSTTATKITVTKNANKYKIRKHTQQANAYTIQLMASNKRQTLEKFQRNLPQLATNIKQVITKGKKWYVLTTGAYTQHSQAMQAKQQLPMLAQTQHPWIRKLPQRALA